MWLDELMQTDYTTELTTTQRRDLEAAAATLQYRDYECPGLARYSFYRRKGHSRIEAVRYALAWCRNAVEQKARRLAHDTGAEGWR